MKYRIFFVFIFSGDSSIR